MLRSYQARDIDRCAQSLIDHRRIVYQLPTGGGKTHMFSEITNRFLEKNSTSVLIVVHRIELLQNTRRRLFEEHNVIATEIRAGLKHIPKSRVYVCMVESLSRRIEQIKNIGLLILDEAHIAIHNKIIDRLNAPLVLGFTATPLSSNKKQPMNRRYRGIICGPQISELIRDKYLSQNITYAPRTSVNRNNLVVAGDDFDEVQMGDEFSKMQFVQNTINSYRHWGLGTKTLIFNVNVAHSKTVTRRFVEEGYNCRHLDASATPLERITTLEWFKKTKDAILCNVGILTAGYDEPTIETIIINKATNSLPHWLQMCGRGSRVVDAELAKKLHTFEKYLFTIIDLGQNAVTHGDWCDDRSWERIFAFPPRRRLAAGITPSKVCPTCEAIVHASAMVCRHCGHEFPARLIPTEELMHQYVLMTKNINLNELILEHDKKKQYYVFYEIIRKHVRSFKSSKPVPAMNDEVFEFVKDKCFKDCRKWCNLHDKKFNKWHQNLCLVELQKELKYEYRILQEDNKSRA